MDQARLTALFRKLGAPDPEGWARSQIEEGINQLGRFVFLRQAWRQIISEDDSSWIDRWIASSEARPDSPYAGGGHALKKLRRRGATDAELTDLVRSVQAESLHGFCYLLEDPGELDPEIADMSWELVQTDEHDCALEKIGMLHEDVLGMDPTGRKMCPRSR